MSKSRVIIITVIIIVITIIAIIITSIIDILVGTTYIHIAIQC